MATVHEALIAAAEACDAAAAAYDEADAAIKAATQQKSDAAEKADQAIRSAKSATQNRIEIARPPSSRSTPGEWTKDQMEADLYRYKANDCRNAAKLFPE